jgi:hypothetical protein
MWIFDINRWSPEEEEIFLRELEKFYQRKVKFSDVVFSLESLIHRSPGEIVWYFVIMIRKMQYELEYLEEKKEFIAKVNAIDRNKLADSINSSVKEFLYY